MDYDSAQDRSAYRNELDELIEACRDEAELSDPQFASLAAALAEDAGLRAEFERIRSGDAAVAAAMMNVPLPADLREKVALRLAEGISTPREKSLTEPVAVMSVVVSAPPSPRRPSNISRRRMIAGIAALATSAALLAMVWIHGRQAPRLTPEGVIGDSIDFFTRDASSVGRLVSEAPPPADYPFSRDLARMRHVRWRRVNDFLGGEAVAYDLPPFNGRATLYVVHRTIANLPSIPPSMPIHNTGGNSAAAWQVDDRLYVLVVQGDAQTYSAYLDHTQGPLT